jgi:excisionase family DNA binding protein
MQQRNFHFRNSMLDGARQTVATQQQSVARMNRNEDDMEPVSVTVAMAREAHPALGRNRIYTAMQTGALPSVRVGKRICIPLSALNQWVAAGAPTQISVSNQARVFHG